jgi:hypothetical protein
VLRVAEEARRLGTRELGQQFDNLYWAYRSQYPFEELSDIMKSSWVYEYNNQQQQWMEANGEAREQGL